MDLALVSCAALPEPDLDAEPLARALADAGIETGVLAWDDPAASWDQAPVTVLRSCWNYPQHRSAFLEWLENAARVTELWNPLSIVRWNTHKRYLAELDARGVPITPTEIIERGSTESLASIRARRGWDEIVVKPAVSAASYRTLRVSSSTMDDGETHLRRLALDGDVLVQLFLESVEGHGERALIWIDGALTHAIRKNPRFEGQDESVSTATVPIGDDEAALAARVLREVDESLLYARIDVAPGPDGSPLLMELELVEPSLFFPQCPAALERYVEAVVRRVERARSAQS